MKLNIRRNFDPSKLKLNKWQKVLPQSYVSSPQPLYYVQVGNVVFVKTKDNLYTFEVNNDPS